MRRSYNEFVPTISNQVAEEYISELYLPIKHRHLVTKALIGLSVGAATGGLAGAAMYIPHAASEFGSRFALSHQAATCRPIAAPQPNVISSSVQLTVPCQKLAAHLPSVTEYVTKPAGPIYSWSNVDAFVGQVLKSSGLAAQEDVAVQRSIELGVGTAAVVALGCIVLLYRDERIRLQEALE